MPRSFSIFASGTLVRAKNRRETPFVVFASSEMAEEAKSRYWAVRQGTDVKLEFDRLDRDYVQAVGFISNAPQFHAVCDLRAHLSAHAAELGLHPDAEIWLFDDQGVYDWATEVRCE